MMFRQKTIFHTDQDAKLLSITDQSITLDPGCIDSQARGHCLQSYRISQLIASCFLETSCNMHEMLTEHVVYDTSSASMSNIDSNTVDLVVTSPPYPMIEMWDEMFSQINPDVGHALQGGDGKRAFDLIHQELDKVWRECARVLRPGAFLCINIGDATRKVHDNFRLYSNHSRIVAFCNSIGFQSLPLVLWRKQTNAPNKFMGSGMLPSGAYVTLEHEYVIVMRNGSKREFRTREEKNRRRESAFFWEERNIWFSDIWDFKGTRQILPPNDSRQRSAAFPLELAHRLICMYSMQGDVVMDPFLGTGTTMAAGILNGRNSIGFEVIDSLLPIIRETIRDISSVANSHIDSRLKSHLSFITNHEARRGKPLGYTNRSYGFRVMTKQETDLRLLGVERVKSIADCHFEVDHTFAALKVGSLFTKIDTALEGEGTGQHTLSFGS
jgi:modification methylase